MAPLHPRDWADAPPYHYHGTPQPQPWAAPPKEGGGGEHEGPRSLWIGGLRHWMDEDYLYSCFSRSPELVSLFIKRNKKTGQSEGFGFLNFADHTTADLILQSYNGQDMPNADQYFKLNWAAQPPPEKRANQDSNLNWGTQQDARHADDHSDHAIFVGDLAFDVTDFMLQHLFKSRYPSVKSAKVIFDKATGRSKCYGFVEFGDVNEHRQAMVEMNGAYCSTRPMRIGPVPNKKNLSNKQGTSAQDPHNSRLFVGCIDESVTDEDLMQAFSPYGKVVSVKRLAGKNCAFVTYSNRASAEEAIKMLDRSQLGHDTIRVSFARRSANKPGRWNGGHYDRSGFGWCPKDPRPCGQTGYPGGGYFQPQQHLVQ